LEFQIGQQFEKLKKARDLVREMRVHG